MDMGNSENRMEGSYTVEAAWMMTCVLGVIAALLIMTCYIHDKAVAESVCRKIAGLGIRQIQENIDLDTGALNTERLEKKSMLWRIVESFDDTKSSMIKKAKEELEEKFLILKNPEITVELSSDKVVLEYQMDLEIPFGIWKKWIPKGWKKLHGKIQMREMESEELIRLYKGILQ